MLTTQFLGRLNEIVFGKTSGVVRTVAGRVPGLQALTDHTLSTAPADTEIAQLLETASRFPLEAMRRLLPLAAISIKKAI